jgi:hypothetical protein
VLGWASEIVPLAGVAAGAGAARMRAIRIDGAATRRRTERMML